MGRRMRRKRERKREGKKRGYKGGPLKVVVGCCGIEKCHIALPPW